MVQTSLTIAAALAVFVGMAHSYLGERKLIGPLLAPDRLQGVLARSLFARQVLRLAWHATSIAWWGFAVVLAGMTAAPESPAGRFVLGATAGVFLATGVLILVGTGGRHLAWPVFLAIAGLSIVPLL